MSIKDIIKTDPVSHFQYYRKGDLYYRCGELLFRVPVNDTGDGSFERDVKSLTLMRWIRQEIEQMKLAQDDARDSVDIPHLDNY